MFLVNSTLSLRKLAAAILLAMFGTLLAAPLASADDEALLIISNKTKKTVAVYWVNGTKERLYGKFKPGQVSEQPTFKGDRWVIRDAETGAVLQRVQAAGGEQDVELRDRDAVEDNRTENRPTPGGFGSIDVTDENVILAARVAARRNGATLDKVLKAQVQVVAGMNYSLTLSVRIGGELREAQADVFHNLEDEFKVTRWELSADKGKQKPVIVDEAQAALQLINDQRKKEGKAPLVENAKLTAAARFHSENMADTQIFAHTIGRSTVESRVADQGYRTGRFGVGENCARMSEPTGKGAFLAWMGSTQGHREGMLDNKWTEAGIACVTRDGVTFWTFVASNPRE